MHGVGVITATHFYGDGSNLTGISAGTSLSGSTNNTVCTVTGANAIQGEANLTFDGNDLTITGTAPALNFIDTDADDYKIHNVQGLLKVTDTTASADRFVINDNGTGYFLSNFQIGSTTTSPGATLHIKTSYPSLKVDSGGHASDAYVRIISGNAQNSRVDFGDTDDDNIGIIDYDHNGNYMSFTTNASERLRIASDGSCYFGPQIITEADMGWGHDAHQRPFVFSGNQAGVNPADATIVVANPNTDPPSTRLGSFMFGCKSSSAGNSGIKAYIEGWTTSNPSNTYEAGGYIKFVTRQSGGSLTEHFKIDHDGKLYKSGNQFYPLVNYTEVATFSAASVSSNSYTDLRTIYSNYSPKKAGNLIVIHHQSQLWQGGHASGNGDAMWQLLKDEGSGYGLVVRNERIMGNMDGRNYTGGSGLARHHRTVHLMGSFICNGNNFSLKTQGKVDHTNVTLQWYHNSENILQIWEYEKG